MGTYDEKLYEEINQADIISFDIFDTILCRYVSNPNEIFNKLGAKMNRLYPSKKLSPTLFKVLRELADKKSRELKDEVTLKEIYNEFPLVEEEKAIYLSQEIEIEKKYTFLNPDIMQYLNYSKAKNKKIILVSDMYLSKKNIEELLESNGFPLQDVAGIYVSSELDLSKRSGTLFDFIKEKYAMNKILHIGDNFQADFLMAKNKGLQAFHYNKFEKSNELIFQMEKMLFGEGLNELESLRKVSKHTSSTDEKLTAYNIGTQILGPVYTFYIEWIVDYCLEHNINVILPLMREGELYTRLLKNAISERGLSLKVFPIHVSRKSTYLFDKSTITSNEIEELLFKRNLTVKNLFELLGFEKCPTEFICIQDKTLQNISIDNLRTYLVQVDILQQINQNAKRQREYFNEYISKYVLNEEKIVTVDLGFDGTIQSQLENVFERVIDFHHLIMIGGNKVKDKLLKGMKLYPWLSTIDEYGHRINKFKSSLQVIESLSNASTGSTRRYEREMNEVIPILEDIHYSKEHLIYQKYCWNGIEQFQIECLQLMKNNSFLKQILNKAEAFLVILERLVCMPTKEEAVVIGEMIQDESYLFSKSGKLIEIKDEKLLAELGIELFLTKSKNEFEKYQILWPEGVIAKNISDFYKKQFYKNMFNKDDRESKIYGKLSNINPVNYSNIYIYGAGELGLVVAKILDILDIEFNSFIDKNAKNINYTIYDKNVISIEEVDANECLIIIASLAFKSEIKNEICMRYADNTVLELITFD